MLKQKYSHSRGGINNNLTTPQTEKKEGEKKKKTENPAANRTLYTQKKIIRSVNCEKRKTDRATDENHRHA